MTDSSGMAGASPLEAQPSGAQPNGSQPSGAQPAQVEPSLGDREAARASATFSVADAVQLAVVERSRFIESRHAGSAIVLDADGQVLRSLGNPDAPVLARSSLKPFQAIAIMSAGVELTGAQAVIASASHSGTAEHVQLVRELLARAELPESALLCPADWPGDSDARDDVVRAGGGPHAVFMNCSGKHAAMLLACVQNDWPTENYLDPRHPLQSLISDVIEEFTGEKIAASAVDGCGAPVHAVSLAGLARGFSRIALAASRNTELGSLDAFASVLAESILANGWAIEGRGKANSVVIDRLGLVAKMGAEGVMVMSTVAGTAVALKMLDGSLRAATATAITLLADAGALDRQAVDETIASLDLQVKGGGRPVGRIRVAIEG